MPPHDSDESGREFDHDRMRSVHPVQVTGGGNLSLRTLDVELEKIDLLKTAFPYDRRYRSALGTGALAIRRFDLEGAWVILLVCDDDKFWPMPHSRMNSANALIPPRVPQEHLIVARIGSIATIFARGKDDAKNSAAHPI